MSALALTTLATCKVADHGAAAPVLSRATPTTVSAPDAWKLFDRSVASGYVPDAKPVTVSLDGPQLLLGYKIDAPAPYRLSIVGVDGNDLGFAPLDLSRLPRGWQAVMSDAPVHVEKLQLVFTPLGAAGSVPELELWTDAETAFPTKPDLTVDAPPAGYIAFKSAPGPDNLSAGSCEDFPLELTIPPAELIHAYVVYGTTGAFRSFSLQRSVNGLAPAGGNWLAGDGSEHVFVDQIDPESLVAGANTVRLCLPADATNRVSISKLRIVGELDRGTQFASNVTIGHELRDGGAVLDGNTGTVAKVAAAEPVVIDFERLVAPDMLHIVSADSVVPKTVECLDRADHAIALAAHRIGSDVELEGGTSACAALRLTFSAAVDIAELRVIGSGAADRTDWSRMVITSAPEHFGDVAWVGGFTVRPQSASGGNHVVISGKAAESLLGDFGDLVHRGSGEDGAPWSVDVDATYSDGSTETRTIVFDRDSRGALADAKKSVPNGPSGNDTRFSTPGTSVVVHTLPTNRADIRLGTSVGVDVPVGAVTKPTDVTVRHLPDGGLPPLDPGMVNVTAPKGHGYEFLPHGQRFAKAVETIVPYDVSLIPSTMGPDDVHTYFYDPVAKHWQKLDRTAVDVGTQVVHSSTNHFTIMINAVLAVPANPTPQLDDPTSVASIPPASPAAGIDLMEPPTANATGDARTGLPVRLPRGRGAYTPSLSFSYSSAAENGWLGVGWDLSVSSVGIDTRWGVPTYADGEEVRYMLDGAELVPTKDNDGPACVDGNKGRRYHPRVEGRFAYIQRCGADPATYWFEVTDTNGTLYVYGNDIAGSTGNTSLLSTKARPGTCSGACPPGVARWFLNRVKDIHGNETTYTYVVDDITGTNVEPGRDVYPASIKYTSHVTGSPPTEATDLGPNYTVEFFLDSGARPDTIISGRGGFKQVTRKLLHSVRVKSGTTVVSQYVLTYSTGQFEKTVLSSIKQYGQGGCSITTNAFLAPSCGTTTFLDEHTFSYMSEIPGFADPIEWTVNDDPQSAPVLGKGNSTTNFGSLSVGAYTSNPQQEFANVGVNGSFGDRHEGVGMYDLNGDGLPDQAYVGSNGSGFSYTYNQKSLNQFSATGGPPIDAPQVQDQDGDGPLGKEHHSSWGIDATASGFGASLTGGYSNSTSRAKRVVMDADGDGYVDIVDAEHGQCFRSGPCAGGHQCFTATPFGVLSMLNPSEDSILNGINEEIKERGIPGDPVVQWTAPYRGNITLNVNVALLSPSLDGVVVKVYLDDAEIQSSPVTSMTLPFDWTSSTFEIQAGQRLYLRVANGMDGGVDADGMHDRVNAAMTVTYKDTCDTPFCANRYPADNGLEPTGNSLYTFRLPAEQRLVPAAIVFPTSGHVHLYGQFHQNLTADDTLACVELIPAGVSTDSPCSNSPYTHSGSGIALSHLNASKTALIQSLSNQINLDLVVNEGDQLVLRADSNYTMDPGTITFDPIGTSPRVAYTSVCDNPDSSGSCSSFSTDPAAITSVPLDLTSFGVYVPPVSPTVAPPGSTPYPFIIPSSKPYTVDPFSHPFNGAIPVTIAARSNRYGTIKVIDCGTLATCNASNQFGSINAGLVGDSLSFEVLGPIGGAVPSRRTITIRLDSTHAYTAPLIFRQSSPTPLKTPFAGGYRGWRNAFWNENAPFAPTQIIDDFGKPFCANPDDPNNTDPTCLHRADINFEENALQHTLMVAVASTAGTSASVAPAWITRLGDAFVAANGDMNGGNIGGNAGGLLPEGGLYEGDYARLSGTSNWFLSASIGLQQVSINGSLDATVGKSTTTTTTDLVDLNGDGVVDMIAGPKTYAGRMSSASGPQLPNMQFSDGFRLRSGFDYSLSMGGAARDTSAGGKTISVYIPPNRQTTGLGYTHTVGLQMGRSQDTDDLIDINGDGLPDRVQRRGTAIEVQYNLGSSFGTLETLSHGLDSTMNQSIDGFQAFEQGSLYGLDSTSNALSHETTVTQDDSITVDVFFARFSRSTHQTSSRTPRQLIDVNGDGLPDLVMKKGSNIDSSHCTNARANTQAIYVQLNRGADFGPTQCWPTPNWNAPLGPTFSTNFDWLLVAGTHVISDNDVLAGTSSQQSTTWNAQAVIPIWSNVNLHAQYAYTSADDTFELAMMDIDGDGVADHVLRHYDPTTANRSLHVKRNLLTGRANLLQAVHRPLGSSFTLDYTTAGNTQAMPHHRQVLSRVEVDDGVDLGTAFASPNLVTAFAYEDGRYDRNEKTFMGFSHVTAYRADGGYIEQYFDNSAFATMGTLQKELRWGYKGSTLIQFSERDISTMVVDVTDGLGSPIGATSECLAALPDLLQHVGDLACKPQLPVVTEEDTTRSEGGPTKTHRVHVVDLTGGQPHIDRFGNVLSSTDEVDEALGADDDVYASVTYDNTDLTHWHVGLPLAIEVHRGGASGELLRQRSGDYMGGPDLRKITVLTDASSGATATTQLDYDVYGNVLHVTTPPNATGQVETYDVAYDTIAQTYPISETNAFTDKSTTSYNLNWGVPTVEVDAAGGRIVRTYDKFGRLLTVATSYDPSGTTTLTNEYHPEESPPRAITTAHGSAISTYTGPLGPNITTASFTDGFGRTIETRKSAVVGGVLGTTTGGAVQRDVMGHVGASYQPFWTAGASTTFVTPTTTPSTSTAYDGLDRAIAVYYPDSSSETTSYDIATSKRDTLLLFHTTVRDPNWKPADNTHSRETFTDEAGLTREFIEYPDTQPAITTYGYRPTGELTNIVDAESKVTSLNYDLRGLRLSMTSPDSGTISQQFDAMGNRLWMTDANHAAAGNTVTYTYSRDRLTQINYPTVTKLAKFTYTKGRVTGITDETGTRTYVYGSLGEIKEDIRTIKNSSNVNVTFDTRFTYDSLGRQLEILYPDGTSVRNTYDEGGLLSSVTGTGSGWSRVYADQIQYDQYGHRTRIRYGNNVYTTASYDQLTTRLSAVQTNLPSNDQVQNLAYLYDPAGNPTSITNTLAALTASSGNHPGKSTLTLTYDGADQLFTANGTADVDATTQTTYTETTHYTPSHNIKDKSRDHQLKQGSNPATYPAATNFSSLYTYNGTHAHLPDTVGGHQINYDPNGNPTQRLDASGANQTLVWDDDNRLIQVIGGFGTQNNIYDSDGLRVRRDSGSQHTIFASQYFDLEGTNQSIKHIYAGGTRVASVLDTNYVGIRTPPPPATSGTPYFFHDDHLGSTTVVTTDTGTVQESHEFFSDGELWIDRTPASPQNRYLFNGKPFDRDTGFYDFGQRFYDPRSGLWLGPDPILASSPNEAIGKSVLLSTSAFSANSPERFRDPDGRCPICIGIGLFLWATENEAGENARPELSTADIGVTAAAFIAGGAAGGALGGGLSGAVGGGAAGGLVGQGGHDLVHWKFSGPEAYANAVEDGAIAGLVLHAAGRLVGGQGPSSRVAEPKPTATPVDTPITDTGTISPEGVGAMQRLRYKGAPYHYSTTQGVKNPAPNPETAQTTLDNSLQITEKAPRRVGIDRKTHDFVIFDQTVPGEFHGHVETWAELNSKVKAFVIKEFGVSKNGKVPSDW